MTYETKTVRIHLPERGQYAYLMLTRFDGEGHLLADEGWGGTYIHYTTVSRDHGLQDAVTGDAFSFIRQNEWLRDTPAEEFVKDLEMGRVDWGDFGDEDKLSAPDVMKLAGREAEA